MPEWTHHRPFGTLEEMISRKPTSVPIGTAIARTNVTTVAIRQARLNRLDHGFASLRRTSSGGGS